MQRARIVIHNKAGVFDAEGKAVRDALTRLGYENNGVRIGKTIEVRVSLKSRDELKAEIDRMCADLLVNPVLEEYSIEFLDDE